MKKLFLFVTVAFLSLTSYAQSGYLWRDSYVMTNDCSTAGAVWNSWTATSNQITYTANATISHKARVIITITKVNPEYGWDEFVDFLYIDPTYYSDPDSWPNLYQSISGWIGKDPNYDEITFSAKIEITPCCEVYDVYTNEIIPEWGHGVGEISFSW